MYLASLPVYQLSHHKHHHEGWALIEVLLSLGLSSVMFLVLFMAQSHTQKVLIYSQQLHFANRLLDQVANQMWAYPSHHQVLISSPLQADLSCLNGRLCAPLAMTQAWAAYWQSELQQLPGGKLGFACPNLCVVGGTAIIKLSWLQSLASATSQCEAGSACIDLKLAL